MELSPCRGAEHDYERYCDDNLINHKQLLLMVALLPWRYATIMPTIKIGRFSSQTRWKSLWAMTASETRLPIFPTNFLFFLTLTKFFSFKGQNQIPAL